jgi:hypothetical protein
MAKGQHLSAYQQKIVNRYYEHLDTIAVTKLAESVSELYLCTDAKKAERLWAGVARALDKTAAKDAEVRRILTARDVKALAAMVGKLSKP